MRSRWAHTFVLLLLFGTSLFAQQWTPDLVIHDRIPAAVSISPDGKWVVFTVRDAVMTDNKSEYVTQLHLAGEGREFQLTYSEKSASQPAWSPDGKWVVFVSSRDSSEDVANLWVISPFGGEAQKLTDLQGSVSSPAFSRDGKKIFFLMRDPETEQEKKDKKGKNDAQIVDEDLKFNGLYAIDFNPWEAAVKSARAIAHGKFEVTGYDLSPDGSQVAFSHMPTPSPNDWPGTDISIVPGGGGQSKVIVDWKGLDSDPKFSSDGKWIAFVSDGGNPKWAAANSIYVISPAGGAPRKLADTYDMQPSLLGWSRNSDWIYFSERARTSSVVNGVSVSSGETKKLIAKKGVHDAVSLARDADAMAFVYEDATMPPEVYWSPITSYAPRKLTDLNVKCAGLQAPRTEEITWKSKDGREIEGLLTYPIDYQSGRKYPLLLIIHGGPAGVFVRSFTGRASPFPVAVFAQDGFAVLRVNPRGSSGYGKEFRFANYGDWGVGDYQDLMSGVDYVIAMGVADGDHLGVMGWSYGGYMTSWVVTQTRRFKAAVVGAGVTNLMSFTGTADIPGFLPDYFSGEPWENLAAYEKHSAMFNIKGANTPTLILHGAADQRVPLSQGQEFYNALKRQGASVKMVVYPRTPHGPREPKFILDMMKRNLEWFQKIK